jgi:heme exporter protein C
MNGQGMQFGAASTNPGFRWVPWVGLVGLVALIAAQVHAVMTSPPEVGMGHLQKILYVHVPIAWMSFIAFFVVFVASIAYLVRGNERRDLLAASAAEVGTVLTALTLALGSIWARPTWGTWWTWDPRLTLEAVLLIIFIGYLALRAFTEDAERRARWSAAVGILGALNVPVVYMSVRWWRTIHQTQSSPDTVDPSYVLGLRTNAIALLVVLIYLIARRYQVALLERKREVIAEEAALTQGGVHVGG